jgi:hypothetical protein
MEKNREQADTATENTVETGRREALLKIGKYGAYVAPAVLAVVLGKRAEASCSVC